jgi:hypothetical protein
MLCPLLQSTFSKTQLVSIEKFVLWAIFYVLLVRVASPLGDFLERCARKYSRAYASRLKFEEEVLKDRLEYTGDNSNSNELATVPTCYQMEHEYLIFYSNTKFA